jgi:hypothetical protein
MSATQQSRPEHCPYPRALQGVQGNGRSVVRQLDGSVTERRDVSPFRAERVAHSCRMPGMQADAESHSDGRGKAGGRRLAGGLIVLAGLAGVTSFVLGWARVVYPTAEPGLATVNAGHARVGLFLGSFMIVAGLIVATIRSRDAVRAWATIGIACGLALGAFAIVDLVGARHHAIHALIELAARSGQGSVDRLQVALTPLIRFSFRTGIYLALVAAALALAAGAVMLRNRPEPEPADDVPP